MKPKTYPEMNAKIVDLLRLSDEQICHYAAQRIEELQAEIERKDKALQDVRKAVFDEVVPTKLGLLVNALVEEGLK